MATYSVRLNDFHSQAASFQNIGKTLASIEGKLNSVANTMDGRDSGMSSLKTGLSRNAGFVAHLSKRFAEDASALRGVSSEYIEAERIVLGDMDKGNLKSVNMNIIEAIQMGAGVKGVASFLSSLVGAGAISGGAVGPLNSLLSFGKSTPWNDNATGGKFDIKELVSHDLLRAKHAIKVFRLKVGGFIMETGKAVGRVKNLLSKLRDGYSAYKKDRDAIIKKGGLLEQLDELTSIINDGGMP